MASFFNDPRRDIMNAPRYWAVLALCALLLRAAVQLNADSMYAYATIQASCAPWDGPAVEVILTKDPVNCDRTEGPYLALGVWKGLPIHSGQEVNFDSRSSIGFASQCAKAGDCERAESGMVVFENFEQGKSASGHYELFFKGGKTVTGSFDAKWCDKRIRCG